MRTPDKSDPPVPLEEFPNRPVFGDEKWIKRRGPLQERAIPRLRKKKAREKRKKHAPIWQRIEGEWKPLRCRTCNSVSWVVIDQEDLFVNIQCAAGHQSKCLVGFMMTKPDED